MRENIWQDKEYTYEAAYGFIPNLTFYLHEDDEIRPFMIVVPGGGYCMVVPPEGEVVAKEFYERGMNCAVLTYTTDITFAVPLLHQPMEDLSRAVRYVRKNAGRLHCDPSKIIVTGFSAGGHVCGSLGVHYADIVDPDADLNAVSNRPDAMILGYPVITSGEYTHDFSMYALIGKDGPQSEYEYFSLEKHVTADTPPTFIWQTVTDDLVPIENSMMFSKALRDASVPYAYYAFPAGWHGLSVLNDAFKRGEFGEPYTMEQVMKAVAACKAGKGVRVPEYRIGELKAQFPDDPDDVVQPEFPKPEFDDISAWPNLAMIFLGRVLSPSDN